MRQGGAVLFDNFDRRYKEGLDLILSGAMQMQQKHLGAPRKK
jgi:hypothetical protein